MKMFIVLFALIVTSFAQNQETINREEFINSGLDIPFGQRLTYLKTFGNCSNPCDFNIMKGSEYDNFIRNRPFVVVYNSQNSFDYQTTNPDLLTSNLYLICRVKQPTTVRYTINRISEPSGPNIGLIVGLSVGLPLAICFCCFCFVVFFVIGYCIMICLCSGGGGGGFNIGRGTGALDFLNFGSMFNIRLGAPCSIQ